jgi:hypothetical protein
MTVEMMGNEKVMPHIALSMDIYQKFFSRKLVNIASCFLASHLVRFSL